MPHVDAIWFWQNGYRAQLESWLANILVMAGDLLGVGLITKGQRSVHLGKKGTLESGLYGSNSTLVLSLLSTSTIRSGSTPKSQVFPNLDLATVLKMRVARET